ncbi:MAG: endopeptidase La [Oligoflexales bacterium]|nr:endopeptidase La [Oligoflexales bacterium]
MSTKKSTGQAKLPKEAKGLQSESSDTPTAIAANTEFEEYADFPLLVLPQIVLFPGHSLSISSLEGVKQEDFHLAQKGLLKIGVITAFAEQSDKGDFIGQDLSTFGTEAIITGIIKLSDGGMGAVLRGVRRFIVSQVSKRKNGYVGKILIPQEKGFKYNMQFLASVKALKNLILKILKMNPAISQETMAFLYTADDPAMMCDLITPYLSLSSREKVAVLGCFDLRTRVKQLLKHLSKEVELLQISTRIQEGVRYDLQDNLKKNFLREQMVAIKRELGEMDGDIDELEELRNYFKGLNLPKEAKAPIQRELDRLGMMHPGSPEYLVTWNYLHWVKDLPWAEREKKPSDPDSSKLKKSKIKDPVDAQKYPDLKTALQILNKGHYGLPKIKERILEYIAVLEYRGQIRGQILLLVGPPGVGKTSLVSSMAKALGRPFVRISLGGVRDEAEIRGHRRTYIGAMPGKIIQAIKDAKSSRAVVLLDEIDKVGTSGHGFSQCDLSSALLEVLDQEQNKNFTDHYLGFPFDLSSVIFVATANALHPISAPLLDRMEILEIRGYTEREKLKIANSHLIPSIAKDLSLSSDKWKISEEALLQMIRFYTREAGMRQLRRELMTIGRKVVKSIVEAGRTGKPSLKGSRATASSLTEISEDNLYEYLGSPTYIEEPKDKILPPGVAIGLAYTSVGGDILYIESRKLQKVEGGGGLTLTGSLGTVMKESAQTALSFLISHAELLGLETELIIKSQIHLHLPDGATPKDGPSAGIAILCTLSSLFLGKSIPSDFAMTGEITLRGQVLPVGGIKEKLLAAHRYGKKKIILPRKNWSDLEELPPEVLKELSFFPVQHMFEPLLITGLCQSSLVKKPVPVVYSKKNKNHGLPNLGEFDPSSWGSVFS